MRSRLIAAFFAICLAASAQTMSIAKLRQFLESNIEMIKKGTSSDRELALFLAKVKLSEKLDERGIEDMQGDMRIGPKTLAVLRRLASESASLPVAAPVAPALKPKPIAPPTSEEQAAIIDDVREYALNYTDTLPDFICTQLTRRFAAPLPGTRYGGAVGGDPRWQLQDTLQIRLSFFEKREHYVVVLMNSAIVNKDYEKVGGSKAFGEFGSMMREIFEPLGGKRVMAFRYHVRLDRSKLQIGMDDKLHITVAYGGLVEVEPDTHRVKRITQDAEDIPSSFPMKETGDILDYDYQDLSGHTFLLPLKSQVLMKTNEAVIRLEEEFRLYRKYSADAEIQYDAEPIAPLPDDKTKETKDPAAPAKK
jgi:hypothetical protein